MFRSAAKKTSAAFAGTLFAASAITAVMSVAAPSMASAQTTPYVVSVGDSYISGEAGRWAGNTTSGSYTTVDAGGANAYNDAGTTESTPNCHRSTAAEIHIGGGVGSKNLACSGATTATAWSGSDFKPGLDFYDDGAGHIGQAKALQQFASSNSVKMVVVSIGGNDFNFGSIVQTCVTNFLTSSSLWPNYCNDDSSVTSNFTSTNITAKTTAIKNALNNIRTAMTNAGYSSSQWTMVVQLYPSPVPSTSTGFRYSQSGYTRQTTGGCGFWNADATWANNTALTKINSTVTNAVTATGATNIKILNLSTALNGRRLCETGVGLLEEKALTSWTNAGAVDKTEWVQQIRTVTAAGTPYFIQESLHPNYWGQKAIRNCVRKAYNAGVVKGGTCTRGANGLNTNGEPNMNLP